MPSSPATLDTLRDHLGMPAIELPGALVYEGDCFEVLRRIPDGSIPLTVTSPPFNLEKAYETGKRNFDEYAGWLMDLLDELHRVTTPSGAVWIELPFQELPGRGKCVPIEWELYRLGLLEKFYLVQTITWCYEAGQGRYLHRFPARSTRLLFLVKDPQNYVFNADEVRVAPKYPPRRVRDGKGGWRLRGNPRGRLPHDWWAIPKVTSGAGRASKQRAAHPCQMPLEIADRIVRVSSAASSPPAVVLDPFGGSGTSALASVAAGRNALVIELHEVYADLIAGRLAGSWPGENDQRATLGCCSDIAPTHPPVTRSLTGASHVSEVCPTWRRTSEPRSTVLATQATLGQRGGRPANA